MNKIKKILVFIGLILINTYSVYANSEVVVFLRPNKTYLLKIGIGLLVIIMVTILLIYLKKKRKE